MCIIKQRKEIKRNIKGIKNLTEKFNTLTELHQSFEYVFEKISNRNDEQYTQLYSVDKIFNSKTIRTFKHILNTNNSIIVEFVRYKKAPQKLVIIFNGFEKEQQTIIDFYILKGEK